MDFATAKAQDKEYQVYTSALNNFSMYTEEGVRIIFTCGQHITDREDIIAYLDDQISKGQPGLTKGAPTKSIVGDPLEGLKAKWEQEYGEQIKASILSKAMGESRDMGSTDSKPAINPASTTEQVRAKASIQAPAPKK